MVARLQRAPRDDASEQSKNGKIRDKGQRDCFLTMRKGIYISRGLLNAFINGGKPLCESSKWPKIKNRTSLVLVLMLLI